MTNVLYLTDLKKKNREKKISVFFFDIEKYKAFDFDVDVVVTITVAPFYSVHRYWSAHRQAESQGMYESANSPAFISFISIFGFTVFVHSSHCFCCCSCYSFFSIYLYIYLNTYLSFSPNWNEFFAYNLTLILITTTSFLRFCSLFFFYLSFVSSCLHLMRIVHCVI